MITILIIYIISALITYSMIVKPEIDEKGWDLLCSVLIFTPILNTALIIINVGYNKK